MFLNRKELKEQRDRLQKRKEEMGINHNYKESEYKNELVNLINMFQASNDLEAKEDIANQIIALRGELPLDIKMELESLRAPKR